MSENTQTEVKIPELIADGTIYLSGEVTGDSVKLVAESILKLNRADDSSIQRIALIVSSYGGEVDAMFGLLDLMSTSRLPVYTYALGKVCSAGLMIAMAGDQRLIYPNATVLSHRHSGWESGSHAELMSSRKRTDELFAKILSHYRKHSVYNTDVQVLKHLLHTTDLWLTPKEAVKHGLFDNIVCPPSRNKRRKAAAKCLAE